MIISIFLILVIGYLFGYLSSLLKLPKLVGMIFSGILIGPYILNIIDPVVLSNSDNLRKLALVIILIKAGFTINFTDFKHIGLSSLLLSFIPATFEIIAYTLLSPLFFDITVIDSMLMGTVLSAVSPAVVVPRMVNLIENNIGTNKKIPQMILAGASLDDVFVIVLFTNVLNIALGDKFSFIIFSIIPLNILISIIIGIISGFILTKVFTISKNFIKLKTLIIILFSLLLVLIEDINLLKLPYSSLLSIIIFSGVLKINSKIDDYKKIIILISKCWIVGEILLFVLVGSNINITYTFEYFINSVILILLTLCIRSIGVYLSINNSNFNLNEKLFCIISFLPKATVQAAIGSIPLSLGLASGPIILSVSVIAILITAPISAFLLDKYSDTLLK